MRHKRTKAKCVFFINASVSLSCTSEGSPYTVHLLQSQRGKEFASTLFLQPGASYEQGKWSDPWTLMPDIVRLTGTSCAHISASSGTTESRFREDTRVGVSHVSIEFHLTRPLGSKVIVRVVVACQRAECQSSGTARKKPFARYPHVAQFLPP